MLQQGPDEQTAIRLAKNEFGQEYPDVESPLHNAYIYTDKTSEAATKKEEKKPVINQVMSFLEEHYGIRRNLILDRLEFMPYTRRQMPEKVTAPCAERTTTPCS